MTKNEKEKLTMTLGAIGDCMTLISRYNADYKQAVDKILADETRTSEFKNEQIAYRKEELHKNVLSAKSKIKEAITEIRQFVGKPFDLSQKGTPCCYVINISKKQQKSRQICVLSVK